MTTSRKAWSFPFLGAAALVSGCGAGVAGDAGMQLVAEASYREPAAPGRFALSGYRHDPGVAIATINLYVAPDGDDRATGTQDAPFRTLARAARAAAAPGTTVWVAPGTYAGPVPTSASMMAGVPIVFISTTSSGATMVPATTLHGGESARYIGFASAGDGQVPRSASAAAPSDAAFVKRP
jgi:hypothetical protein